MVARGKTGALLGSDNAGATKATDTATFGDYSADPPAITTCHFVRDSEFPCRVFS